MPNNPKYKRVLLKLSGEMFLGDREYGIDPKFTTWLANEIKKAVKTGTQIGIVVGGGNIFRGNSAEENGLERTVGDYIGMLATIMNALALQAALEKESQPARVLSAIEIKDVCEPYIRRRAIRHLEKGRVVIFAAGTGNPFFTTDTTAALRAAEIDANVLLMAKHGVDGVYDSDPKKNSNAKKYPYIAYNEVLSKELKVIDAAAVALAQESSIPIIIFDFSAKGIINQIVQGEKVGTIIADNSHIQKHQAKVQ